MLIIPHLQHSHSAKTIDQIILILHRSLNTSLVSLKLIKLQLLYTRSLTLQILRKSCNPKCNPIYLHYKSELSS